MTVARRFEFGGGDVEIAGDGAVSAVRHPIRGHSMLLLERPDAPEATMHSAAHRWGKGFVLTDVGGARFDTPASLSWKPNGVDVVYHLGELTLHVGRRVDGQWRERYELRNTSDRTVTIGSIAVSVPCRDVYGSSRDSLRAAVHAHLWTGGADAWAWLTPMDGSAPGLGMFLDTGELWAYSVESRNAATGSNLRGHLYLHVTDHARCPHAMGGQPRIALEPGDVYEWAWRLDWFDDLGSLHAARRPMVEAPELTAEVGRPLELRLAPGVTPDEPGPVTAAVAGMKYVGVSDGHRRSVVGLLFHPPLRELTEQRVGYILDRQRARHAAGSRSGVFLPYDTTSGLTVLDDGWRDWSDARERVGMALLLQACRDHGWGDADQLTDALARYQQFVVEHVVDSDGTVADDTQRHHEPRLYNFPWFARFLLDQGELDLAVRIVDRYYALDGQRFLAFGLGRLLGDLSDTLRASGRPTDAARMRDHLLGHATTLVDYGDDLPPHEVNYEQSMVAPLLELLVAAHRAAPDQLPGAELTRRLPWLTAFSADQPDARLRYIPIRHWDGYWFGRDRRWGDVFPHYWSVLSAEVLLEWPEHLTDTPTAVRLRAMGEAILRGNLVNFRPDGAATCAFVYPSCVNGVPAHSEDPLANDQDWALVYALRLGLAHGPS